MSEPEQEQINQLKKEIEKNAQKINTTEYRMSIGEIINLYKDEDLVIDPDFQRLFRWKEYQKSRLIESIFIGIPLPSIFIQQKNDGKWEVIDGLQRLSTILEFVGELKKRNQIGSHSPNEKPLELIKTNMLPSLGGINYEQLPQEIRLLKFKRYSLNLVILKEDSDEEAKYELF